MARPDTTENNSDSTADSISNWLTGPSFRSIQIDGTTLLVAFAAAESVDLDAIQFPRASDVGLGIRVGLEHYVWASAHATNGKDILYNILGRFTIAPEPFRVDLFFGTAGYRTSGVAGSRLAWDPKIGAEIRWMFLEHFVGLLLKANSTIPGHDELGFPKSSTGTLGIGFVVGYQP